MSEELDVLKIVTERLNDADIPYMITGSIATNYYSIPRMTRDIDIVIELKDEDVAKIVALFENDFYIDEKMIKDSLKHEGLFNIIHNDKIIKIDFIIKKKNEYRDLEFSRKQKIEVDNVSMWLTSLEDMILSKLYWAKDSFSEIQLRDVANLINSSKNIDADYIEKWVKKLGLEEIYKKV